MDLYNFMSAARDFRNMGDSVISQFEAIVDGETLEDQNPNALRYIAQFLKDNMADFNEGGEAQELFNQITKYLGEEV